MEKTIEKYNSFKENEAETWKSRFTWRGLSGKDPKHTTTITKFFEETNILEQTKQVFDVLEFFKVVEDLAEKYTNWVKSKGTSYKNAEYADMRNFFIGAIGEFFFVELLNNVKCLTVPEPGGNEFTRFDFNFVSPSLKKDKDFGIDLTGVANDTPCVFQVKFWNPFAKTAIPIEVFQKADSEGCRNGFIKLDDDNNIFLCHIGSEEKGIMPIKENKVYKNKIVVIGSRTLESSINGRNKLFWENLYKKLNSIK